MMKQVRLIFCTLIAAAVVLSGCNQDSLENQKAAAQRLLTKERNQATITHIDTLTVQSVCGRTRDFGDREERAFYVDLVSEKAAIEGDTKFSKVDYEKVCAQSLSATERPTVRTDDAERQRLIDEFGVVGASDAAAKGMTAAEYKRLKEAAVMKDAIDQIQADPKR